MSRKALGRGLRALIPEGDTAEGASRPLPIERIDRNDDQPRKYFNDESLKELSESIKIHGVLEPVIVRPLNDRYEIVVGERRWRAAKLAGLKSIPAIVRTLTDLEALELALIENIQREDLNPIEEAETFRRLIDEFNLTQDEVAQRVGKSRSTVANSVRLLDIDVELKMEIARGNLSAGHAKALLGVSNMNDRLRLAERVIEEGLSVRALEQLVSNVQNGTKVTNNRAKSKVSLDPVLTEIVERMQQSLGTKVRLVRQGNRGRIEINYYSEDEMERIIELLGGSLD